MKKIFKPFKFLYTIIDKLIVVPISRIIYRINELMRSNSSKIERVLNRPNVLVYVSLFCAIALFMVIDSKALNLVNDEAEILSNQQINVIYNEEAYVVEGVPDYIDITLIGRKSDLYLAKQLGDHEAVLDLSSYSTGTYKVKLKYNHSIDSVNYKLDPSMVTVKISEKVSSVKSLAYDLLNENKLDSKLSIKNVVLDRSEVIVKGSSETLNKIAKVKALIDLQAANLTEKGTFTVNSIILVAYDHNGEKIPNVEIVPTKISASITVDSYYKEVPIKVVTEGKLTTGFALSSAISSVSKLNIYGDENVLSNINYIEALIDIDELSSDKTFNVTLVKPLGVRYMTESSTSVEVKLGTEASNEITNIPIEVINLGNNYSVTAISETDLTITIIAKGVASVLNNLDTASIKAYIDLSGYTTGTYDVEIKLLTDDVRLSLVPKTTTVKVKIVNKSS